MRPNDPNGVGMVDGKVKTLTEEEYKQAVAERNRDEQADLEDDDDLSDLDELMEHLDEGNAT